MPGGPTCWACTSAGSPSWRQKLKVALDTSAESPVPVRTVLQLVGGWIGKLGRVWGEGQRAARAVRGSPVFLPRRAPGAAVSARVICSRQVFGAPQPRPAD